MLTNLFDFWSNSEVANKDSKAVIHNDSVVTYKELNNRVCVFAKYILDNCNLDVKIPVAVFLPKSIGTVISDLACSCIGNPFMNLDIKTPFDRLSNTINLINPAIIVTDSKHLSLFDSIDALKINIDEVDFDSTLDITVNDKMFSDRRDLLIDTDPFCIINTSGSTGTPKGVVLNHRSFFDFMDWADETYDFNGTEIMGSLSPAVFDIFVFELCMMIKHNSSLVILDATLAAFPAKLLQVLKDNCVSFIFWVPSIMVNIANMDLLNKIPVDTLKTVWFAGEVFPTKQFLYWYDLLPGVQFTNLYGPIEITLDCTYYIVENRPDESQPLPIGIPCRNTDILILDENDQIADVDKEGELCVRGTSLAMGYYNNEEKTSMAFTQNPLNKHYPELIYRTGDVVIKDSEGLIHFRGRRDSLIKHLGYRIELGEIEHVIINQLGLVKYCCAVYNYQKKEISLYYERTEEISVIDFRKSLQKVVPNYMIPNRFIRMDLLPRNTNGKIDRLQLKELANSEE